MTDNQLCPVGLAKGNPGNERSPRDLGGIKQTTPKKACAEGSRAITPVAASDVNAALAQLPAVSRRLSGCQWAREWAWGATDIGLRGSGRSGCRGRGSLGSHLLEGVGGTGRAGQVVLQDVCGERSTPCP